MSRICLKFVSSILPSSICFFTLSFVKNVSKFAESAGVKRQNVEKALKNSKVERVLATDDTAVFRALIKNFDRKHANIQLSRLQNAEGTDCMTADCNSENHCGSSDT